MSLIPLRAVRWSERDGLLGLGDLQNIGHGIRFVIGAVDAHSHLIAADIAENGIELSRSTCSIILIIGTLVLIGIGIGQQFLQRLATVCRNNTAFHTGCPDRNTFGGIHLFLVFQRFQGQHGPVDGELCPALPQNLIVTGFEATFKFPGCSHIISPCVDGRRLQRRAAGRLGVIGKVSHTLNDAF